MPDKQFWIMFSAAAIFYALLITCCTAAEKEMDLTKAVIHHTGGPDRGVDAIRKYHMEVRGWDDIGYHYVIRKDGTIEAGRPISERGAHALTGRPYSRNHYIGIALTGINDFTDRQYASLKLLIKRLPIKHIERHHEECPGWGLDVEAIAKELNVTYEEVKK